MSTSSSSTRMQRAVAVPAPSAFWHPFSTLPTTQRSAFILEEGRGTRVRDADGRWYFDATASLWYANVGHGEQRIASAVGEQAARLAAYSNFGNVATRPTLELAEQIGSRAPVADPRVFLTSGGSDAVDSAVKMVRRYWALVGSPARDVVLTRTNAYHGMHGHGTSMAGIAANFVGYADESDTRYGHVAHDDAEDLARRIELIGPDRVAAFFVEPIIGAGGVIPPAPGYLERVQEICRSYDVLLVADEVVTGFGRTGDWFASSSYGLEPDLLLFAKGVTSGYAPLGGVVASRRVWEAFAVDGGMFRHGYTYSGHAVACAAGLANLRVLDEDGLVARAGALIEPLREQVSAMAASPHVREVRTGGLLAAVALHEESRPGLTAAAVDRARANGVLTRLIAGDSLQISPPFVITEPEIADLCERLVTSIEEAARR